MVFWFTLGSFGAAAGGLAGTAAEKHQMKRVFHVLYACFDLLMITLIRGQGRAAGAAEGHMKCMQEFGNSSLPLEQHVRNDCYN